MRFNFVTLTLSGALAVCFASLAVAAEEVEHPIYKSWARYPVGTRTTINSVTVQRGETIRLTMTYKLIEIDDEKLVILMETKNETSGQDPQVGSQKLTYRKRFPLFPGVKKEDIGKPDGSIAKGVETLKVGGKEYKADWFDSKSRVEAGDAFTRTWMHDEIPGKLMKAVTKVPAGDKITTLELVEIKKP